MNRSRTAAADEIAVQDAQVSANRALPVTERILRALPGPLLVWAGIWAAIPLVRGALFYFSLVALDRDPGFDFLVEWFLFSLVPTYVVALSLYSAAKLARELPASRDATASLVHPDDLMRTSPNTVGAVLPPVLLATGYTVLVGVAQFERVGLLALLDVPLAWLLNLAVMTFVWVFMVLLVELNQFGQQRLSLGRFPEDLSLGLRPIGSLALMAFMLYAAAGVPILFTLGSSVLELVGGLAIFLIGVGLFFLSLWRLHLQMKSAKAEYLAQTRALFRQAYAPLREDWSIQRLAKHAEVLGIAETIQRRAEAIHEWPLDQGMVARVALVITGVITGITVRLILVGAGL